MAETPSPRAILDRMMGFAAIRRDSVPDLLDWVEGCLASPGIPSHRHWNEDRPKDAPGAHVGTISGGAAKPMTARDCRSGGRFPDADHSVAGCGPGDVAQAHQAGEYLKGAQYEAGHAFMQRLIRDMRA